MNIREGKSDLTGNTAYGSGLFGGIVVWVEYRKPTESPGTFILDWKRANWADIGTLAVLRSEGVIE